MKEHFRNNYFTAVRTGLLLMMTAYTILSCSITTGASPGVLLLLALYTGALSVKELFSHRVQAVFLIAAAVFMAGIFAVYGYDSMLLAVFFSYELISFIRPKIRWYFLPVILVFLRIGDNTAFNVCISLLLCVIYIQHDHIVEDYRRQTKEDTINEQSLKHDIDRKENEMKEEIQKSLLMAENQLLEERTQLSQTLHDKLGHNINGSVYQLEAVKVLMEKDPEKAKSMVQAVIDQLRTGMDEIRAILRRKRPEKHRLAVSQLENLCEDCRRKGIDARLCTEGELSAIPDTHLEVILDNCFEAVSNSLKYSKCSKITISISVLNKIVRCSISDNGAGCSDMTDGMGISGMRRRIRQINGVLEIEPEMGFTVNMLLPLQE